MTPLFETIKPFINHYGYWAVFFGIFFESLGLPLPGETLIVVAGLAAAKGALNISWIIVIAVIATFASNNLGYALAYVAGRAFLIKYGKYVFLNETRLLSLENFMSRHGSKVVVIARFVFGMRQFNGFIAGSVRMPFGQFALFNMIGAIIWVGFWTGLAFYFGKRFDKVFMEYYFFTGIIIFIIFIVIVYHSSKKLDKETTLQKPPAV